MEKFNLGIDIGGTFIKYALMDKQYHIKDKWKIETIKYNTADEFYDYICSNIKLIDEIDVIGISAPGLIDKDSNVKLYAAPNVAIMYGTNINDEIKKRTHKKVSSINDAKSAGLCEFEIGNAKGSKSSAFLIIGTGTGGCICDENGVVYGKDAFAGEFHNMPFVNDAIGGLAKMGDYASMTGLINIYNSKVDMGDQVQYGYEVCKKYLDGNKTAELSVDEWIINIVAQLIVITVFYNPEVICIGGGISEEDWFINKVKEQYKKTCIEYLEADFITTKIDRCKYNNDANILGAIINASIKK
ncbi:ROK family protein [Clostridium neonatale]|uniref:ROK family protein n=1 Tax=Clostridium neonatale TaxID=137838 RepID=UPI0012E66359|nr:ROK family protein [Clostridium neonatale]CAG9709461.1 Putative sugar kinase, ROK family [Clostridium neonatale]CAG9717429.1 Putative sugar kinase, ROK family [Clostridium neonatale]CAI3206074.1 putative sugar kinase, ROK family [Clostridium neonatale]CAI3210290.1 putative sugar kinase, ROK family [Clostridium neonatale]CAI3606270.1 putative sugar kinase, ROK family [Clostridium neonatale]